MFYPIIYCIPDYFDYICIIDNSNLFSAFFLYLSLLLFLISLPVLFEHIFRVSSLFNSIFESIAWMLFVVALCITMCKCKLSQSIGIITLYFKWDIKNLLPFRSFALPIKIYIYIYILVPSISSPYTNTTDVTYFHQQIWIKRRIRVVYYMLFYYYFIILFYYYCIIITIPL